MLILYIVVSNNTRHYNTRENLSSFSILEGSIYEAPCEGFGAGVAVEVWCRSDVGGLAPSNLTFTLRWGSVHRPRLGMGCSRAMGGFASHRLGVLCVGCRF